MTRVQAKPTGWEEPIDDVYGPLRERRFDRDDVLVLFDARHAAYRSIHTRDLSTDDGVCTSALHGLIEIIQAVCTAANTGRFLCVWDGGLQYKRRLHADYKARQDRSRSPEEMREHDKQQGAIRTATSGLSMLGVPQVRVPDLEADDVIGIIAKLVSGSTDPRMPRHVLIVSDDKDYYQLVDPRIFVWRGAAGLLVDEKDFRARHEITPEQYVDYKALVGEPKTGDNIPGVDGIGDVSALKLVGSLGGIERIIMHAKHEIVAGRAKKQATKLYEQRERARLSYKLSRIMRRFSDAAEHGVDPAVVKSIVAPAFKYAIGTPRPLSLKAVLGFMSTYQFSASIDARRFASTCGFALSTR
jgi:DNA polymerase I